jgi:hypothetical protein
MSSTNRGCERSILDRGSTWLGPKFYYKVTR